MHKNWSDSAWEEYIAWQTKDIKLLRINQLIYRVRNGILEIAQCGTHYKDK